jgi:hypothetical protein
MKTAPAAQPGAPHAPDELGALRAALDVRLAALEAGLANPDQCESIETLVLDLARVATEEAEVAARHATRQAQLDANKPLTTALAEAQAAEASLDAERAVNLALQRDLGKVRSELNTERQTITALNHDAERARVTLETERATNAAGRADLHDAGQRIAASDAARQADADALAARQRDLVAAQHDAAAALATHQRELQAAQHDAAAGLAMLQQELQAAQRDAAARAADLDAARARADALELSQTDLRQALNEAQASAEAAHRDRDDLAHALENARQGFSAAGAEAVSRLESLDSERANAERAWRDAEARAEAAIRDRDAAVAELDAARQAASAVQENERGRFDELREKTERRILDLEVALLRGNAGSQEHDVEIPVPLEDTVVVKDAPPVRKPAPAPAQPPRGANHPPAHPSRAASPPGLTRAVSRQAFREALGVQIDGEAALLVDLSLCGAQVLSQMALKPARAVRMLLPSMESPVLCRGKIAWARLEPAFKGKSFRYRAGLFFTATDEAAVQAFITRHAGGSPENG